MKVLEIKNMKRQMVSSFGSSVELTYLWKEERIGKFRHRAINRNYQKHKKQKKKKSEKE
jgi:hypothetical protein